MQEMEAPPPVDRFGRKAGHVFGNPNAEDFPDEIDQRLMVAPLARACGMKTYCDVDNAVAWLNDNEADTGWSYGWRDGDFLYEPDDWWAL